MEKIELPIFKKYYLTYSLKPELNLMMSCYRYDQILYKEDDPFKLIYKFQQKKLDGSLYEEEFNVSSGANYITPQLQIDNNIDDLEKLILFNGTTDILVQCFFECPEMIESIEIVEVTNVLITTDSNNYRKISDNFLHLIKSEKLELTTEELIARFSSNAMIKELYEFILILRERRIKYDIELQAKAEEARDYNQYMTWKTLEQARLTGRFQRFIKQDLEDLESVDIEKTKIVDSVENTGASFSIKKNDNGSN